MEYISDLAKDRVKKAIQCACFSVSDYRTSIVFEANKMEQLICNRKVMGLPVEEEVKNLKELNETLGLLDKLIIKIKGIDVIGREQNQQIMGGNNYV